MTFRRQAQHGHTAHSAGSAQVYTVDTCTHLQISLNFIYWLIREALDVHYIKQLADLAAFQKTHINWSGEVGGEATRPLTDLVTG